MTVDGEINGLYPTPRRIALCRAITEAGQIYSEAGQTWDKRNGCKVSARMAELLKHGWVEVIPPAEHRDEWSNRRAYYRLTAYGRAAIERGRR